MSDESARSLRAHLEGLGTWGIKRMSGSLPIEETEVEPEVDRSTGGYAGRSQPKSTPAQGQAGAEGAPAVRRKEKLSRPEPESGTASDPGRGDPNEDPTIVLPSEAAEVAQCTRCSLSQTRTKTAYGVGDPNARLMFVGEAPGHDEDVQGEPFVGRAGQLLNRIIGALGVAREDVYIANVLKCRPPNNRDPRPDEVASCTPFLMRQIDVVKPEMIVALGKPAANYLLQSTDSLGRLRGRLHQHRGIPVVATYHPAYLLRTPDAKKKVWQDLQVVIERLGLPGPPARE